VRSCAAALWMAAGRSTECSDEKRCREIGEARADGPIGNLPVDAASA